MASTNEPDQESLESILLGETTEAGGATPSDLTRYQFAIHGHIDPGGEESDRFYVTSNVHEDMEARKNAVNSLENMSRVSQSRLRTALGIISQFPDTGSSSDPLVTFNALSKGMFYAPDWTKPLVEASADLVESVTELRQKLNKALVNCGSDQAVIQPTKRQWNSLVDQSVVWIDSLAKEAIKHQNAVSQRICPSDRITDISQVDLEGESAPQNLSRLLMQFLESRQRFKLHEARIALTKSQKDLLTQRVGDASTISRVEKASGLLRRQADRIAEDHIAAQNDFAYDGHNNRRAVEEMWINKSYTEDGTGEEGERDIDEVLPLLENGVNPVVWSIHLDACSTMEEVRSGVPAILSGRPPAGWTERYAALQRKVEMSASDAPGSETGGQKSKAAIRNAKRKAAARRAKAEAAGLLSTSETEPPSVETTVDYGVSSDPAVVSARRGNSMVPQQWDFLQTGAGLTQTDANSALPGRRDLQAQSAPGGGAQVSGSESKAPPLGGPRTTYYSTKSTKGDGGLGSSVATGLKYIPPHLHDKARNSQASKNSKEAGSLERSSRAPVADWVPQEARDAGKRLHSDGIWSPLAYIPSSWAEEMDEEKPI